MVAGGQKVLVPALRSRVLLNHESVNFEHKIQVARATSHIKTGELSSLPIGYPLLSSLCLSKLNFLKGLNKSSTGLLRLYIVNQSVACSSVLQNMCSC